MNKTTRYGIEIDLSYEHKTGCPIEKESLNNLHGNTRIPEYPNTPSIIRIYRERKSKNRDHFLWKLDIICEAVEDAEIKNLGYNRAEDYLK